MAYAQLKTDIAAVIRNNGNQEITGNVLQGALLEMINALGANYQYAGVADTSTTITTTEANVFYLLTEAGTYSNMSSSIVHASGIGIALWNGSAWSYQNVPSSAVVATDATPTEGSTNPVQSSWAYTIANKVEGMAEIMGYTQGTENLFSPTMQKAGIVVSAGKVANTTKGQSYLLEVNPSSTITIDHKTTGNRFAIWSFISSPQIGDTPTQTVSNNSANALAITLGASEHYILVFVNTGGDVDVSGLRVYYGTEFITESSAEYMCTNERADTIEDSLNALAYEDEDVPLSPTGTIANYYIGTSGTPTSGGSQFSIEVFPVTNGDKVTIVLSGGVGSSYLWGLYNGTTSADVSSANLVTLGTRLSASNGTNNIDITQDGILAVTKYTAASYGISKENKKYLPDRVAQLEQANGCRYTLQNNELRVAFPYGGVDMLITLKPTGGNGLFDFYNFVTIPSGGVIGVATETLIFRAGSDWHGPYIVAAKSNIDGDNKSGDVYNKYFTGGNHQYNNKGEGSTPTASLVSLKFFVNGEEKTTGNGSFETIRVEWLNSVQAYNTTKADGSGRAVLNEKHTLEICANKFTTTTEIMPLEDVTIETFYGLQYTGAQLIYPNTIFVGGANRGVYTAESNSGNQKPNGIYAYGTAHSIEMIGDVTFDIGDRRFYDGTLGALRTSSKGYLFVVKNTDFSASTHSFLRGYWNFMPKSI